MSSPSVPGNVSSRFTSTSTPPVLSTQTPAQPAASSSAPLNTLTASTTGPEPTDQSMSSSHTGSTNLASAIYFYLATESQITTKIGDSTSIITTDVSVGVPETLSSGSYKYLATTSTSSINGNIITMIPISVGTPFPTNLIKINKGLSAGDSAAIGIGGVILGVILAAAFWFLRFFHKKRRGRNLYSNRGSTGQYEEHRMTNSKAALARASALVPKSSAAVVLYNHIPQPVDDNTIKSGYSKLKSRIDGHVQKFYFSKGGDEKSVIDGFSRAFAGDAPIPSSHHLQSILGDSQSRMRVLQAGIASIVITRMLPDGPPAQSFLPLVFTHAYASFSNNTLDGQVRAAFRGQWRVISACLSQSLYGRDSITEDDPRITNIQEARARADLFLRPLAATNDHESRLRNLEEIMKRAARLGWLIFSQPSEYAADWTDKGRGVVYPALLQLTDENGEAHPSPVVFSPQEPMMQ
ncbi:uncharacterized protein PV09_07066 [Verruconis gallopava]|uniref:Uncharacterized protein n=1 Tax=Verruconis gallopava TaxID=253628 RepID=A0A0D2AQY5_9PEZI|nr:uncharacterized protein PV09_07066 [Verruconis gallopava]KIW01594.1 hypothetical protein PV09_07066 [Verruconis gallopava]